jgi:REP element-mobilizing transposase RayT
MHSETSPVFIQPYEPHDLNFAYCYRLYLRIRTHAYRRYPALATLSRRGLDALVCPNGVRVLQCATDSTDVLAMLSLQPSETISSAADKVKGRVSKWLREALTLQNPTNLLSKGYFASTIGKSTRAAIDKYLSEQGEHHGYAQRHLPPIFVDQYQLSEADLARVSPKHAVVVSQFHFVLATSGRRGIFGAHEGRAIAAEWQKLQQTTRTALVKVSFVPDHVHIALRAHPAESPADIVARLMNSAQQVMSADLVRIGLERLWQPGGYIGSYGNLASPQIRKYIERWEKHSASL